jgi:hypothetical protein
MRVKDSAQTIIFLEAWNKNGLLLVNVESSGSMSSKAGVEFPDVRIFKKRRGMAAEFIPSISFALHQWLIIMNKAQLHFLFDHAMVAVLSPCEPSETSHE